MITPGWYASPVANEIYTVINKLLTDDSNSSFKGEERVAPEHLDEREHKLRQVVYSGQEGSPVCQAGQCSVKMV